MPQPDITRRVGLFERLREHGFDALPLVAGVVVWLPISHRFALRVSV